jgi:hypothetical protein
MIPTSQLATRIVELEAGLAVWRVHLDAIREQNVNARVMPHGKFERLTANIAKDGRLESLPFCVLGTNGAGEAEFHLISGHHRTRAARVAAQTNPALELTRDQISSKQLSHNALQGEDDRQILQEIYASIDDLTERIATGLTDADLKLDTSTVPIDDLKFSLDFEVVNILFLPLQYDKWRDAMELVGGAGDVALVDHAEFDAFAETIRKVSKRENVRNMSAIVSRMVQIVSDHYRDEDAQLALAEQRA